MAVNQGSTPVQANTWQSQIIAPGATVTGNNQQASGVIANPMAVALYNMTNAERKQIALALKNAKYKVPTNGVFSDALVNAYSSAVQAAKSQAMQIGQPFDNNFFTAYLARETEANATGGGSGRPSRVVSKTNITEEDARSLINKVARDLVGQDLSENQIAKYTQSLKKAQKERPTVTTYSQSGATQNVETTPGLNPEQFLIQQIAQTDQAKANQAMGFYSAFKNLLGAQ